MIYAGTVLGDYEVISPYEANKDKIGIRHKSGEAGDFDRKAFEDHMARAVEQFYKENF